MIILTYGTFLEDMESEKEFNNKLDLLKLGITKNLDRNGQIIQNANGENLSLFYAIIDTKERMFYNCGDSGMTTVRFGFEDSISINVDFLEFESKFLEMRKMEGETILDLRGSK